VQHAASWTALSRAASFVRAPSAAKSQADEDLGRPEQVTQKSPAESKRALLKAKETG
jgi:hypothetical protein